MFSTGNHKGVPEKMNTLYYPIKSSPVLTGDQEKLAAAMLDALKSGRPIPDEYGGEEA